MGRVECTDAGVTLAEYPQVEDQLLRHRPRLKKPPSGGSNFGAASASPPSRFERLTSLKPPALPGDIYGDAHEQLNQNRRPSCRSGSSPRTRMAVASGVFRAGSRRRLLGGLPRIEFSQSPE